MADLEDEAREIEEALILAAAGGLIGVVDKIRDHLARGEAIPAKLIAALAAPGKIEATAFAALLEAYQLGISDALLVADPNRRERRLIDRAKIPASVVAQIAGLDKAAKDATKIAKRLRLAGAEDDAVAAPVLAVRNRIKSTLISATNEAVNEGVLSVAIATGADVVWVAERDACQHCLALQGEVVKAGESFDPTVTYAAKPAPAPVGSFRTPPRHPNCRCHLELLRSLAYAEALRREADRSILRGFHLPSESQAARVAAAERLLERGVVAPKSVIAYANKAVKKGRYPSNRVPSGSTP